MLALSQWQPLVKAEEGAIRMAISPEPVHQKMGAAPVASKHGNGVLLVGYLLSCTPVAVVNISFLFSPALFPSNYDAPAGTYNTRYLITVLILAAVSAVGSVSAIIIGFKVRRRTPAVPEQAIRLRIANTVRVLGITGLTFPVIAVAGALCSFALSN